MSCRPYRLLVGLALALSARLAAQASGAASLGLISRHQLPNGLDVVLAPDPSEARIAIELWVRMGSRDEPAGRFGLAHFFEHATPIGQGLRSTTMGRQLLDSLAIDRNAVTRFDYTRYFTLVPVEGLEVGVLAVADRLRADPVQEFAVPQVELHRRNVAAEIVRFALTPWGWPVRSALLEGTFGPGHPYGHHLYGSEQQTRDISADDLLRWHRAHFRPEYATLILVGGFDGALALATIRRTFGSIPGGRRPAPGTAMNVVASRGSASLRLPGASSATLLSWALPPWGSPDHAALTLIGRILVDRLAGDRPAPVDSTSAVVEFWQLGGRLGVSATLTGEPARPAVEKWLYQEVKDVSERGVPESEFEAARHTVLGEVRGHLRRLGWFSSRAELLGEGVIYTDDPAAFLGILQRLAELDPSDVQQAARRWIAGSGFRLSVEPSRP